MEYAESIEELIIPGFRRYFFRNEQIWQIANTWTHDFNAPFSDISLHGSMDSGCIGAIMQATDTEGGIHIAYTSSVSFEDGFAVPEEKKLAAQMLQERIKRNFAEGKTNKIDIVEFLDAKDSPENENRRWDAFQESATLHSGEWVLKTYEEIPDEYEQGKQSQPENPSRTILSIMIERDAQMLQFLKPYDITSSPVEKVLGYTKRMVDTPTSSISDEKLREIAAKSQNN